MCKGIVVYVGCIERGQTGETYKTNKHIYGEYKQSNKREQQKLFARIDDGPGSYKKSVNIVLYFQK